MNKPFYKSLRLPWSLMWRAVLGVTLASLSVIDLETVSLDSRLSLTPKKDLPPEIRLVRVNPFDTANWQKGRNMLGSHSIFFDAADDYFWDESLWADLITKTLKANPKKIGISLYLGNAPISSKNKSLFSDERIIWAVPKSAESHQIPSMASYDLTNVGEINISEDSDGKIRRYQTSKSAVGDFFQKLTSSIPPKDTYLKIFNLEKDLPMVDAHLILSEHPDTLADLDGKIVIFGRSLNESNLTFNTSLGAHSKLGISGIIASNFVSQSWIKIASPLAYLSYFALLGCAIIWLISRYPHKVALILLVFLGLVLTLLSVYLFDTQNIWLPITGVWVQITTTWVLFLGYSLNRMEQSSLKLREEKKLHQQLEELKINFVSLISHDLKTPIAKIQAVTSRLRTLPCSTEIQDDLTKIDKYSKELHRYIQNVLKLLQVETSKFKLNIDSVDLNLLIHEIVTELQSVAQEKQVSISLDLAPLFPIDGDYQLIKEIFLNLIQNAIQYSNPQSQVKIIVVEQDHFIKVRITDQGMGIPSEELPFLFHKFYRGKNSSINQQGSGLGLYLVKYFIELHNGKIHIESVLNNGTTVTVWLPIEQKIDLPENQHDSEDDHDS